jgi:hypothetical protein
MADLISIVHPYVWKIHDKIFISGIIEENRERDGKISDFLRKSLDSGIKVLRYEDASRDPISKCLEMGSFAEPPFNSIVYDERITEIRATSSSLPIKDTKPENISEENWKIANEMCISHSRLKEIIGTPDRTFYIGGYLDYCLMTAAAYQRDFCNSNGEIFVVEDFCPAYRQNGIEKAMAEFSKRKIKLVNHEDASKILNL